jgi:uroporphyrinogen-III synthase
MDYAVETYNPWTVVNLVFHHLAEQGLHPILGEAGDPGAPAADLLRALGIAPAAVGNQRRAEEVAEELAGLREHYFGER